MERFRYSRWDGQQQVPDIAPEDLFDQMADDVMAQGDLGQALRRLFQQGARDRDGSRMDGIHDLLRKLKDQRRDLLRRYNMDGIVDRLRARMEEAIELERQGIERRLEELDDPSPDGTPRDPELSNLFRQIAAKHQDTLNRLPGDLGGRVQALRDYDFLDPEARRRFQDILNELQRSVLDSLFQDISQRLNSLTPEDMAEIERMVRAIQEMAEAKQRGETPDFEHFKKEFGQYLGDDPPESLDELLNRMRSQMTQMQSLVNSLSSAHQNALRDLVNQQLMSPGLDAALESLAQLLWDRSAYRSRGQGYDFSGEEAPPMDEALRVMERLHEMDGLERQLDRVRFGAPLEDLDREAVGDILGDGADQALDALEKVLERLETAGLVKRSDGHLTLTPRGVRRIGQKAMLDVFQRLKNGAFGNHAVRNPGHGQELTDETRPYEFGQPFYLHLERTLRNALTRGLGVPVSLAPGDFELPQTECTTRSATVLMLDLSRSMPMRGNFTAAKKVALALNQLIRTQFPRDQLYVVGFSGIAREVKSEDLPGVVVGEFGRGTNMQAGLMIARKLLALHRGATRQVIMITDGEPTAYLERNGEVYVEFPPSGRVLRATMQEVHRCTSEDITINIFMLERSYGLRNFVQQMAQSNKGWVFFTSADQLGEYLLVDYLSHKRRVIQ